MNKFLLFALQASLENIKTIIDWSSEEFLSKCYASKAIEPHFLRIISQSGRCFDGEFLSQETGIPKWWSPPATSLLCKRKFNSICMYWDNKLHPWTSLLIVKKAKEVGTSSLITEGDALNIIEAIHNTTLTPHWSIVDIINYVKFNLVELSFWSLAHVFKDVNFVAHNVARYALLTEQVPNLLWKTASLNTFS